MFFRTQATWLRSTAAIQAWSPAAVDWFICPAVKPCGQLVQISRCMDTSVYKHVNSEGYWLVFFGTVFSAEISTEIYTEAGSVSKPRELCWWLLSHSPEYNHWTQSCYYRCLISQSQANKSCGHKDLLKQYKRHRNGEESCLCDYEHGRVVDARWCGLSISETVDVLDCSCTTIICVCMEWPKEEKI